MGDGAAAREDENAKAQAWTPATQATAKVTVSDWEKESPERPFSQEQTFNFLELQPYHE